MGDQGTLQGSQWENISSRRAFLGTDRDVGGSLLLPMGKIYAPCFARRAFLGTDRDVGGSLLLPVGENFSSISPGGLFWGHAGIPTSPNGRKILPYFARRAFLGTDQDVGGSVHLPAGEKFSPISPGGLFWGRTGMWGDPYSSQWEKFMSPISPGGLFWGQTGTWGDPLASQWEKNSPLFRPEGFSGDGQGC
jgi:hypothetical protein